MWRHIAGVHLSSDHVTSYFVMDADLYNGILATYSVYCFMMLYSSSIWYVFLV